MELSQEGNFSALPDVPLGVLFRYLDTKTLLSVRLVCHQWNAVALTLFPQKIAITSLRIENKTTSEAIKLLHEFNPLVFQCIRCKSHNPDNNTKNRLLLTKYLSCLKQLNVNENITYIRVCRPVELESLVPIVNFHGLPNLATIKFQYGYPCAHHTYTTEFLPNILPSLKEFVQITYPSPSAEKAGKRFLQSLVNACPNLEDLRVYSYYDVKNHRQLQRLHLCSQSEDKEAFLGMLSSVADTLTSLTVQDLRIFWTELPILPKLRTLDIIRSNSILALNLFTNLATATPNVRVLKTLTPGMPDVSVRDYLLSKPKNLEKVEIVCCGGSSTHSDHEWCKEVCSSLATFPPNLRVLQVSGECAFSYNPSQVDLLQSLLNVEFPNLVIEHKKEKSVVEFGWFGPFIGGVLDVEINPKKEKKGRRLEICRYKQNSDVVTLVDLVLQGFAEAMHKLAQRWDRVIIKNLNIPAEQMEALQRDVVNNDLPVDFFYTFGQ